MGGNSSPGHDRNRDRTIAAIYCRISLARFGDTIKVDDQRRICRDLGAARGWETSDIHTYVDNSVSAWRRDRRRPGWDAMLAAVERHEVNAIIVYHGDRLIRQPWDLELLLRLADDRRIQLASATGQRDLSNEDDRFIVRIEAAAACREVAATSRRLKSYYERRAGEGYVRLGGRGGRPYGFDRDGLTVRDTEAAVIRDVADRILEGQAVSAICRDLNARQIPTVTGGEWTHGALAKLMRRPRLAGLVEHHGRVIGPAAWDAILPRDTWEAVGVALSGKAKVLGFTPSNDRRYLLSGIARCGTCGDPLAIRYNTRFVHPCPGCARPLKVITNPGVDGTCARCDHTVPLGEKVRGEPLLGYGCINPSCGKKVHRALQHLDPYVEGAVVALLADPRVRAAMAPDVPPHLSAELERLERRRREKVDELADVEAFEDDPLMRDVTRAAVRKIEARIGEIRAVLSQALRSRAVDGLFGVDAEGFARLPLRRRRAVVQALVRITVFPSSRRGPVFDPSSVRLEPAYLDD